MRTSTGSKRARRLSFLRTGLGLALIALLCLGLNPAAPAGQETAPSLDTQAGVLKLLGIEASEESLDYVMNKTQFQLHTLLTEQRHPKTMNLSRTLQDDIPAGLGMLLSVDEDITARLGQLAAKPQVLEGLAASVEAVLLEKKKIYVYGCGATGRLAKQMESSFWRPFWKKVRAHPSVYAKLKPHLASAVEDQLIGEMTGGDRALISSLEGFEDLQLIGRLQLQDRGVRRGDLVLCVTEGGETSSVIGTILAAHAQWTQEKSYSPAASRERLFFVYNNPDDRLLPFERSRAVLRESGITKINLSTGPQAITGSTRMQATTIETFVLGHILQEASARFLRRFLSRKDMARLGFGAETSLPSRLQDFATIQKTVRDSLQDIARFTDWESKTYEEKHYSTTLARDGLITVFIDSTERSPTFRLYPLDTVNEPRRKCWIQVWTPAQNRREAWQAFLGRPFRGLAAPLYQKPFEKQVEDPYLRAAALESLKKAGNDQQDLYDFSFGGSNIEKRSPQKGDLGVFVCLGSDEPWLEEKDSPFQKFLDLAVRGGGRAVFVAVGEDRKTTPSKAVTEFLRRNTGGAGTLATVVLAVPSANDPFGLNQHIALKMLLNAHSTAVMARLGRVIGNTMTNVSPSNLKLIGRATFLIQSHVNDVLGRPQWVKLFVYRRPITYGEANAVLFESIRFLKERRETGQTAEVALSIVRILESLKLGRGLAAADAFGLVRRMGLGRYLESVTAAAGATRPS